MREGWTQFIQRKATQRDSVELSPTHLSALPFDEGNAASEHNVGWEEAAHLARRRNLGTTKDDEEMRNGRARNRSEKTQKSRIRHFDS